MSKPSDEQISKLPKWAREYIRGLERETDVAQRDHRELFDSQEPTDILYGDIYDNPKYLPEDGYGRVRYLLGEPDSWGNKPHLEFTRSDRMGMEKNAIQVTSSDGMEIIPVVSNIVIIRPRRN